MYVLLEQFYSIRPEQCFFVYKNKDQLMINLKAFFVCRRIFYVNWEFLYLEVNLKKWHSKKVCEAF